MSRACPRTLAGSWRRRCATMIVALTTGMTAVAASAVAEPVNPGQPQRDGANARRASVDLAVEGRGYGHGRGMSQYGAQGAALAGLTSGQILDFYYPGTSIGEAHGRVRVLLTTPSRARGLVVRAQSGLTVRRSATGASWKLPALAGSHKWRLRWRSADTTTLEFRRGRGWHPAPLRRWRSIGGAAEFGRKGSLALYRPGGMSRYRGVLRAYGGRPADMEVVNEVRINAYLFGVVPLESPPSWEPAALKAQAVAARTYAIYHRQRAREAGGGYDLCDTTSCQVYGGQGAEAASTNAAVRATGGVIRNYQGDPIIAEFSSSNGGQTVEASLPYQRSKPDPYDDDVNPNRSWTTRLDGDKVAATWRLGKLRGVRILRRDGHGLWGGRVTLLRLAGTSRSVTISGDAFRLALGLKSTYFRIREVR